MCPYLDEADDRCAIHHSLNRLEDSLGTCADCFEFCPIYQKKSSGDGPHRPQPAQRPGR